MMDKPRVSVILLVYKNARYLEGALSSIFAQDYPDIEIIINNDGGPGFDRRAAEAFIRAKRPKSVSNVIINDYPENEGTVRSSNKGVMCSTGKYITLLAADDELNQSDMISRYAAFYESESGECLANAGMAMYSRDMASVIETLPSKADKAKLNAYTPVQMLNELLRRCFFATSVFVPRSYLDKYGLFDERYRLVEDVPFYIKAFARGTRLVFLDFIAIKHRDGGISHGNASAGAAAGAAYQRDALRIFDEEAREHRALLTKETLKMCKAKARMYKALCYIEGASIGQILPFCLKNPGYALLWLIKKAIGRAGLWAGVFFRLACGALLAYNALYYIGAAPGPLRAAAGWITLICLALSAGFALLRAAYAAFARLRGRGSGG